MNNHEDEDLDMVSGNESGSDNSGSENNDSGIEDEDEGEDEEEWGGLGEQKPSRTNDDSHGTKVPPSALELKSIRDATDLYRSSSFKLQVRGHSLSRL